MAGLPGFASHGSSLHLGAGCQQWKLLDVSGTQPPFCEAVVNMYVRLRKIMKLPLKYPQAAQTLFVIYIRDSIALRFDPFIKRMYENGLKIALNSTCSKGFK